MKTWNLLCAASLIGAAAVLAGTAGASTASTSPQLTAATNAYRAWVVSETAKLALGVRQLSAALDAGNLARARSLYGPVHAHYEQIEPVAESFGNLDPEIDARANDVPASKWRGFHRIEQLLFQKNTTAGTPALGKQLVTDVETLAAKEKTMKLTAAELANGSDDLLDEIASSKITGEEERYSHTDLADFQANLAGAREAFVLLSPALTKTGNAALVTTIRSRFAAVQTGLNKYKRATPLGFALYGALTPTDRRTLSGQVDALAEPMSTIASKLGA
ncbi:MAG TPA: iron uptake system protein EfeO [Gaiellaceae bacterium]|nr:iron uptake system protein EfeO [Gaiellaceae bacterium]